MLDFYIPGNPYPKISSIAGRVFKPGDMGSFTEIYMIMELCDSDLKKLCRRCRGPWCTPGRGNARCEMCRGSRMGDMVGQPCDSITVSIIYV